MFNFYNLRKICILHGHVFVILLDNSFDKIIFHMEYFSMKCSSVTLSVYVQNQKL